MGGKSDLPISRMAVKGEVLALTCVQGIPVREKELFEGPVR